MDLLRILHITHSLNIGGLERVVLDLAKGFKKRGHIVGICCLDGKEPLGKEAEDEGIKVISLNKKPGITWSIPLRIAKIINEGKFNLIHTHNEAGLVYGVPAAFLARISNIIHTEHGKEPGYDDKNALKIAEKFLLKKVKHVVTVSHDLKKKIVASSRIDKSKVLVIPNGIDVEYFHQPQFREEKRKTYGIGQDDFVIGNIARMVPLKNHRFLISIFKQLVRDHPELKLILVGDGPIRHELKAYSESLGLSNSAIFLGERKDVAALLSIFDLFILPSLTEGISITLIEALAARIPVIASDVGGNSEIIENGKTGLLMPLDQTQSWIKAIRSLVESEEKRISLLGNAKTEVTKRFSLGRMIENYQKVYYN